MANAEQVFNGINNALNTGIELYDTFQRMREMQKHIQSLNFGPNINKTPALNVADGMSGKLKGLAPTDLSTIKADPNVGKATGAMGSSTSVIKAPIGLNAKFNNTGVGKFMSSNTGNIVGSVASVGLNVLNSHLSRNDYQNKSARTINAGVGAAQTAVGAVNTIGNIAKIGKMANFAGGAPRPWGAVAQGVGKLAGRLIGGGNRMQGTGSAIASGISSIASYFGPVGWAAAAAIELINGAGIGQKRAVTLHDFSKDYASSYGGTARDVAMTSAMFSGKKAGTFDFGMRKSADRKLRRAGNMQNEALDITNINQNLSLAANSGLQDHMNSYVYSGTQPQLILSKHGTKFPELDEIRELMHSWNTEIPQFKDGGVIEKNVIPVGSLHKNKHHIEESRPELEGQITEKGIPVVSSDIAENVRQFAEIEAGEITFTKTVTDQLEEFYKKYKEDESDELAIELGKFLVEQILHNTIDEDKIIKKTE